MPGPAVWVRPVLPAVLIALALLLALAAGPAPAPARRVRDAAVPAGLLIVAALIVAATGATGNLLGILWLASPALAAYLVVLAAGLPRGYRRWRTFGGLTVLGGVVTATVGFSYEWPVRYLTAAFWGRAYPWAVPAGALVTALALGAALVVAADLARRRSAPSRAAGATPASRDWAPAAGALLVLLGLASWVLMALAVQPPIATAAQRLFDRGGPLPYALEGTNEFWALGWDARWASIVLAAGGLRLVVRGRVPGRTVWTGIAAWVLADVLLAAGLVPAGPARVLVAVVGLLVLLGAALLLARAGSAPRSLGRSVVYSGVSCAVGVVLLSDVSPRWDLPRVALPALNALTVMLVLAGVLTALAAAPRRGPSQVAAASAIALLGTVAVLLLNQWRLTSGREEIQALVSALTLGTLVLGCAWIGGFLNVARPRWTVQGVVGLTAVAAPGVAMGGALTGMVATWLGGASVETLVDLRGPFELDEGATPLTAQGCFAGATLAVLALLPRALSRLDLGETPATPIAAPPPPQPVRRAPVATPGVPEILEWPEPHGTPV